MGGQAFYRANMKVSYVGKSDEECRNWLDKMSGEYDDYPQSAELFYCDGGNESTMKKLDYEMPSAVVSEQQNTSDNEKLKKYLDEIWDDKNPANATMPIPRGAYIHFENAVPEYGIKKGDTFVYIPKKDLSDGSWFNKSINDEECVYVSITILHAHSLAALVRHWKLMIQHLGKENCELTAEYCDELLEDLEK